MGWSWKGTSRVYEYSEPSFYGCRFWICLIRSAELESWISRGYKKLKEFRIEYGLAQGELGKLLGVAAKSVARWEQGQAVVTREQWEKLYRLSPLFELKLKID